MICLICRQAETIGGFTSITFERGEIKFVINNVPAYICPSCDETYVEEHVVSRLLRGAEEQTLAGMLNDALEYEML